MSAVNGIVGWHATYSHQFGAGRWRNELFPALRKSVKHLCIDVNHGNLTLSELEASSAEEGYFIDGASVACALSMQPRRGENILDMCAAPGGKSVLIARQMKEGRIVCNELSKPRIHRLKQTMTDFANLPDLSIVFTNHDSTSLSSDLTRLGPFDRILLDAACSSDRHLISDAELLKRWSPAAVKAQAERQWKMLATAAALVSPNGLLVYSTCALSRKENDDVIRKFLGRKEGRHFHVELKGLQETVFKWIAGAEATEIGGCLILPDRTSYGPLYICHLRKDSTLPATPS
jgi:16S rRNA C967 or C1407 C5-methylase (RsmB/RsmF family)